MPQNLEENTAYTPNRQPSASPRSEFPAAEPSTPASGLQGALSKPKLLIVEDDESLRTQMKWALAQGYEVFSAGERRSAMDILQRENPAVVTLDLGLPPSPAGVEEGFLALSDILAYDSLIKVIVITGRGEKEYALKAVGQGAYDFFCKPVQIDELKIVLNRAFHISQLEKDYRDLRNQKEIQGFEEMLGTSPKMQEVFKIIKQTAKSDSNVLITGESGTGKELVARAVHYNSERKDHRFVPVNCGAIAKELIESELFGYVKGAFTGAVRDKTGFLELASGGTLFLDEIGETTPDFQVKLLRAVQENEFNKVGSPYLTRINVRVIAASNRNLEKAIADNSFREDLFYRINVISIHIPPLRQRREDIPMLILHFIEKYSKKRADNRVIGIEHSAVEALLHHDYRGNVRELENAIEYAIAFAQGDKITVDDLPSLIRGKSVTMPKIPLKPLRAARNEFEKSFVLAALKECDGNISSAARLLDVHRQSLEQKIKDLGIRFEALKDE